MTNGSGSSGIPAFVWIDGERGWKASANGWLARGVNTELRRRGLRLFLQDLVAIEAEHEEANGRRQIAALAVGVDRGNQLRQGRVALAGDLLEAIPERVLEADAGLVAANDDGALDHLRFHCSSPYRAYMQTVRAAEPESV